MKVHFECGCYYDYDNDRFNICYKCADEVKENEDSYFIANNSDISISKSRIYKFFNDELIHKVKKVSNSTIEKMNAYVLVCGLFIENKSFYVYDLTLIEDDLGNFQPFKDKHCASISVVTEGLRYECMDIPNLYFNCREVYSKDPGDKEFYRVFEVKTTEMMPQVIEEDGNMIIDYVPTAKIQKIKKKLIQITMKIEGVKLINNIKFNPELKTTIDTNGVQKNFILFRREKEFVTLIAGCGEIPEPVVSKKHEYYVHHADTTKFDPEEIKCNLVYYPNALGKDKYFHVKNVKGNYIR